MLLGVASVISRHHPARLQLFSSPCQLNQEALAWCSVTAADIEQPLRRHGECPAACGVCNWRTLGSCGYFAWQCHSRVLGLQLIPSPAQHSSQNKTYPAISEVGNETLRWHGHSEWPCHLRGVCTTLEWPRHPVRYSQPHSDGMVTLSDHAIWGFHCQPLRWQGNSTFEIEKPIAHPQMAWSLRVTRQRMSPSS